MTTIYREEFGEVLNIYDFRDTYQYWKAGDRIVVPGVSGRWRAVGWVVGANVDTV